MPIARRAKDELSAAAMKRGYVFDFEKALASGALVKREVSGFEKPEFSWEPIREELQLRLSPSQFGAWIKPLEVLNFSRTELKFLAPDEFSVAWIRDHFLDAIEESARALTALSEDFKISFET